MYIWPLGGPGGALMGRGAAEPQVRIEEDTMAIGNTDSASADMGQGGGHCPQRRCVQEVSNKIGRFGMYLKGYMAAGGSEGSTI